MANQIFDTELSNLNQSSTEQSIEDQTPLTADPTWVQDNSTDQTQTEASPKTEALNNQQDNHSRSICEELHATKEMLSKLDRRLSNIRQIMAKVSKHISSQNRSQTSTLDHAEKRTCFNCRKPGIWHATAEHTKLLSTSISETRKICALTLNTDLTGTPHLTNQSITNNHDKTIPNATMGNSDDQTIISVPHFGTLTHHFKTTENFQILRTER